MSDPAPAPEHPRQEITPGYANYVLGVLFVVYVFNFIDRQILSILLQSIKEDLGASDTQLGFLTGTWLCSLCFPLFTIFRRRLGLTL